jgi:hypothetical protein
MSVSKEHSRTIFKQRDVARAIKGAMSAGFKISRIEISTDGKLSLACGNEPAVASADDIVAKLK